MGSSRFAIDIASSAPKGAGGIAIATYELFAGMIKLGLSRQLSHIVAVTDLRMERILRRAGWPLERIGEPHTIGVTRALAGFWMCRKRCSRWCGKTVALAVRCCGRRCFAGWHDHAMTAARGSRSCPYCRARCRSGLAGSLLL